MLGKISYIKICNKSILNDNWVIKKTINTKKCQYDNINQKKNNIINTQNMVGLN